MSSSSSSTQQAAKITADLTHSRISFGQRSPRVTLRGTILEESEERLIFQQNSGRIYSLPRDEIEVELLSTE
jgi:hypothetical protein